MSEPAIHIKNASFSYKETNFGALSKLTLDIFKGECVLLCGGSGCGKTTVTRLINGLIPHYYEGEFSGAVRVCGLDPHKTPLEQLSAKVGSVFQNPRSQFFCVDTTGEVAFGCENMGLPEEEIRRRITETAAQMHIWKLMNRNIFNLSGGEKQKIACAGVSAMQPEIIVLDEPTSNLDTDAISELRDTLLLWKRAGKTVVIAEHRLSRLKGVCDRVILMENGAVSNEYSERDFFSLSDEKLYSLGLRGIGEHTDFLNSPIGFRPLIKENGQYNGEALIFSDFYYNYGKKTALDIPRLEVPQNAVVAVIGHNGAGKSTFSAALCGLKKGFKGSVTAGGKKYSSKNMRRLSYMVMQDVNHQLFSESVAEEAALGAAEENGAKAEELLRRLELWELRDRHPMSLSGGQKQRTAIASAMMSDRPVLILDEPTSGLDYKRMLETARLIQAASREKTVFVVTHDPELIERCCTHILHIENGRIG
ncbi:MAG: ABC transporter ATP-binding protein [Firmicutes bacterium]|nr:ABC transporter ATP-binding protein [Bacillota bacterium]